LAVVLVVAVVAVLMQPTLPQDAEYHAFADQRAMLGIPNAHNVLSNIPFALVGAWGFLTLARRRRDGGLLGAWVGLFAGVTLTAFGSAYYHWAPSNATLLWDRLPMAIGFMAFFAGVIGERVHEGAYRMLLWPLLGAGVGSVAYWYLTEVAGAGDLRPYVLVQFFPLLTIPLMMALYEPRYTRSRLTLVALALYASAKVLEVLDARVFEATGGAVGGHALKHLAAAGACYVLAHMYATRRPVAVS
jgi:hypothetical protein